VARTTDSTRHFPGEVHSGPAVATLARGDRVFISTCLAAITVIAWLYLLHLDRQMSSAMEHDRMMAEMGMTMNASWTVADVLFTFAMWAVMMVGMMAAAAAPVVLLFAAVQTGRGATGGRLAVLMFGLGYVTIWIGFSAGAALAQWALHQMSLLSPAMAASSPYLGGSILLVAGAYQLTPWKGACLTQCRSPLGFLMTNWRDGRLGSLQMGVRHGIYCLGCCWALMGLLFVVGVMNLVWVAALTGLVLLEKIGPAGIIVARVAGAAMVIGGLFLIAAKI
jgi:predicted metal-binding membrane protein